MMTKLMQILMTPVMAFALFVPRPLADCCKSKPEPEKRQVTKHSCCSGEATSQSKPGKNGKCPASGCRDCMASCCVKLIVTLEADQNAIQSTVFESLPQSSHQTPSDQSLRSVFHPPRA